MTNVQNILAPVSAGELIDKLTILRIKSARITDPMKLHHVHVELGLLEQTARTAIPHSPELDRLTSDLQLTNELLWNVEDDVRVCESNQDFGSRFIELARSVYLHNDRRCALKREINMSLGSLLVEEKSYRR